MKENCILILANNMKMFELQLKNIHQDMDKLDLIVVNEIIVGSKINEIKKLLHKYNVHAFVISSDTIRESFPIKNSFVNNFKGAMQVLCSWYCMKYLGYKKLLYLEDDMVVTKDLAELFNKNECSMYSTRLSAGKVLLSDNSKHKQAVLADIYEFLGIPLTQSTYDSGWLHHYMLGGPNYFVNTENFINNYEDCLTMFFTSKSITDKFNKSKCWHGGYLNEVFNDTLAIKCNITDRYIKRNTYFVNTAPEKALNTTYKTKKMFIHMSGVHKEHTAEQYIKNKLLDSPEGEPWQNLTTDLKI